jgi:hypothetical protein
MLSVRRILAALAIGAFGCLCLWVAVPYNNFFLNNSYISDTYFPVSGVVFMLVLVLGVNPLLRLVHRDWVLNGKQLILVFVMLLAAAVVPSQGLLRMLPWSLARTTQQINESEKLAAAIEESGVPEAIFPDQIGYGLGTPASSQLLDELEPGQSIPWGSWLRLVPVWGSFLLACWLLMVGVGLVLFPHWRHTERLPFPLLDVYRSILPEPQSGRLMPAIFRERMFWVGAGIVMFLYATNGISHHSHGNFPSIPLGWNLSSVFSEVPWRYLDGSIKNVSHIYFVLVGMAFFMPNRVSFSIWSIAIAYAVYAMIHRAYFPPYYGSTITDHRNGAMIMVTLTVLYLSRHHWLHVGKVMVSRVTNDTDRLLRVSGWMVVVGALGMFIWLTWAGVPDIWAAVFVLIGFMVCLLIARIVAETGMPFVRITGLEPAYLMAMVPAGWVSGAAIYMAGFIAMLFQAGSRVSAAVMVSHAAGVDPEASPRQQLRIGYLMIGVFVVGLLVCGAVHLYMGYTNPVTLDGQFTQLNRWGSNQMSGAQHALIRWSRDYWPMPSGRLANIGLGMMLACLLQLACMSNPKWPVHPIGMLIVGHYYSQVAWASIMIGWVIKVLIINVGGSTAFRRARPLFLGIIMGEIFSAVIWTAVPVVMLWLGYDPLDVGHIPVLPT